VVLHHIMEKIFSYVTDHFKNSLKDIILKEDNEHPIISQCKEQLNEITKTTAKNLLQLLFAKL